MMDPVCLGVYMVGPWRFHVVSILCPWRLHEGHHGASMVSRCTMLCPWRRHEVFMVDSWCSHCLFMVRPWYLNRGSMVHVWCLRGVSMAPPRCCGEIMASPWWHHSDYYKITMVLTNARTEQVGNVHRRLVAA